MRKLLATSYLVLGCASCSSRQKTTQSAEPALAMDQASCPEPAPSIAPSIADEDQRIAWVREHFEKREVLIPMRDGVGLFTAIYRPRERGKKRPMLLRRTPYSVKPYGPDAYPASLGPSDTMMRDGYVFVYQDVRGRYMSEGEFVDVRPHIRDKNGDPKKIDESTDTWDTVQWLLSNVEDNNGKVGQWGISYPGFYAAAGMIDHHPALVAVSPQAPIADWYFDDFHHHGAFFLPHAFNFLYSFGRPRPKPTTDFAPRIDHRTPDGYQFFLDLGPLANVNENWYGNQVAFWNEIVAHPDYDDFWKARNLLPHLEHVAPAVMTVGGWFDAEDLYGPLQIYRAIEAKNPEIFNMLVMGPWRHGGWSRDDGSRLGNIDFGSPTSVFYRDEVERTFFRHFLLDVGGLELPEALVFETGTNRWREFDAWPPRDLREERMYVHQNGELAIATTPTAARGHREWISDPNRPVPFSEAISTQMTVEYMTDDQRFASRRPDVLTWQTAPLEHDLTLAGPLVADLWVSTSGTDADFIVKLIDVFPADTPNHDGVRPGQQMGGYQMMVRSEVLRGRYRDGYDRPRPFRPNVPARISLPLQDVLHTFRKGHRIMVHVQSTWFPLVDRNPQKFVPNVFLADDDDFVVARHRVHTDRAHPSHLRVGVLPSSTR